jgi:hypothetical protein
MISLRAALVLTSAMALASCELSTLPQGPFADVVGTWTYAGQQTSPVLQLQGSLVVNGQSRNEISGQLTFTETDALGGVRPDAGVVAGRVIGLFDTDFDVILPSGERRHVARISANQDTIRGAWVQPSTGASGEFVAVKAVTP